ncbi:hypothetical protein [Sphingomonas sp. M1A8_2b]
MADTDPPETPPQTDAKKPVTRRRATRATSVPKSTAASATAKPVAPAKRVPAAKRAVAPKPAVEAKPLPAAEKPIASATRKIPKPAPKPRSTKRSTPRPTPVRKSPAPAPVVIAKRRIGGKWGAAIAGGVAVIGAAAALLTLRGSTPKATPPKPKGKHAHQADGTDSSKSLAAGIADPGTIPE